MSLIFRERCARLLFMHEKCPEQDTKGVRASTYGQREAAYNCATAHTKGEVCSESSTTHKRLTTLFVTLFGGYFYINVEWKPMKFGDALPSSIHHDAAMPDAGECSIRVPACPLIASLLYPTLRQKKKHMSASIDPDRAPPRKAIPAGIDVG
jgi:hypothetical protein